jgi:hypothetical protein
MKRLLIGLCAFGLCASLTPKTVAQTVTVTVGPTTDDSYWVWNDEYQCWVWNGPEFQGDYQGHPYSYWHGRHEGGGDRNHRPGKVESGEGERPVNRGEIEQPKAGQRKTQVETQPQREQPKSELEKPREQQSKTEVEQPKAGEKVKTEKPKGEEKSKTEKPKTEEKKDGSKPTGE